MLGAPRTFARLGRHKQRARLRAVIVRLPEFLAFTLCAFDPRPLRVCRHSTRCSAGPCRALVRPQVLMRPSAKPSIGRGAVYRPHWNLRASCTPIVSESWPSDVVQQNVVARCLCPANAQARSQLTLRVMHTLHRARSNARHAANCWKHDGSVAIVQTLDAVTMCCMLSTDSFSRGLAL